MRIYEANNPVIEAGRNPNESHILILEEGPGNPKNKCWYGREAVTDAKEAFRGVRMFANHIGKKEQENRPERDVEAIVGRVKETYLKTNDDGKLQCWGVAKIVEGDSCKWVKERVNESVKAVQEGFPPIMQISINGDGDAEPREMNGERWNYVQKITKGMSVDFVPMGGIRKAGFRDIMESANLFSGGAMKNRALQNLTAEEQERYDRINSVVEAALSPDDRAFMDGIYTRLSEADGDDDVEELNAAGDAEAPYVLTMEDGEQIAVGEPDEIDADGNAIWYGAEGEEDIVLPAAEAADDYEGDAPIVDVEDDVVDAEFDGMDEDEVDFDELKARYPVIAAELEKAEMATRAQESTAHPEELIAHLQESRLRSRAERVLLESRILAERKLVEAGVPEQLLTPDKLVGLSPEMMDREIERAIDNVEFTQALIREAMTLNGAGGFHRGTQSGNAAGVGQRILAGARRQR